MCDPYISFECTPSKFTESEIYFSKKIAKRTKTQEGKTSRGATFSKDEDIEYLVQDDRSYGP